ncbi:SpoIID/LytB domain-containing protein [Parabacteroides sp. OttesenSCG-928-N08]|nr:SpoIID/LytB domain-containing protein [Parabacteroides sp. OttesenSCG-928-N08]
MSSPVVNVGIVADKAISLVFHDEYIHVEEGIFLRGEYRAVFVNNKILFNGKWYEELFFEPASSHASFELKAVTFGIGFHWERKEDLRFKGSLNLIIDEEQIVAINQVDIEEYLHSVISSEMSASASKELLKAHAIISRSWLLAQIEQAQTVPVAATESAIPDTETEERIRWYNREDHTLFDVCADDHCQRYQGITRAHSRVVNEAVNETRGELLVYGGQVCDTRYSKCCGGASELYENCWDETPHFYLTPIRDAEQGELPSLNNEQGAESWLRSTPTSFCSDADASVLKQVLNGYDQETIDFYRWKLSYSQEELSELIHRRSGIDFGLIRDLIPIERGVSGRIVKLRIVGNKKQLVVGKELEIRRLLSESHLYSSAFVVDKEMDEAGNATRFTLTGGGWGHGVGLCQIGAAVMSSKGYDYRQILAHYFPAACLEKRY